MEKRTSRQSNTRKGDDDSTKNRVHKVANNQLVVSSPLDGNFFTVALRSRGGLSPSSRPEVWKVLIGYDTLEGIEEVERVQREKQYRELLYRRCWLDGDLNVVSDKSKSNVIDLDVARTQVRAEFYSGGKDYSVPDTSSAFSKPQQALRRILHTLCAPLEEGHHHRNNRASISRASGMEKQKKKNMGPSQCYVQGMNEIAGLLLYAFARGEVKRCTETVEADTFWCLHFMLLYVHPNESSTKVDHFMKLLRHCSPELYAHLESIDSMILQSCATRWMIALFTQDFSVTESLRVWDFLLSFGKQFGDAMLYVAVAICLVKQKKLLSSCQVEEIIPCLKAFDDGSLVCCVLEEATTLMTSFPFSNLQRLVKKTS